MRHELADEEAQRQHLTENMALAFFRNKQNKRFPSKADEQRLSEVGFVVHKLNHRPRPKAKNRIKIISCFSEFGCEILGCLYCIPRLLKRFPGDYVIAMGWWGREYLYRHLVDEFWEIKEDHMWLRDHAVAFHHISHNLKSLEEAASAYGEVVTAASLGKYAVSNMCRTCGKFWHEWRKQPEKCPVCKSTVLVRSMFSDVAAYKPTVKMIPKPSRDKLAWAESLIQKPTVGVFARARKTYGRNLPAEFYVKLIQKLEAQGYNVIWLGEKHNTLPCPVEHVLDFSRMPESRDLERTLAIICNLEFTVQFWTASTRLAALMGVPFLLFESPEQICVSYSGLMGAQEGKRLELMSFGPKKIVLAHYHNVLEKQDEALDLVDRAVGEMKVGNYEEILGMVEDAEFAALLQEEHKEMLT